MLNKSIFLISSCFLLFASAAPTAPSEPAKCGSFETLVAFAVCEPLINSLKTYVKEHKGQITKPDVVGNMTVMCEKTTACLAPLQCKEALEAKTIFDQACNLIHFMNNDNQPCITKFFKEAYLAQSSNKSSCLRDYAFLEKDLPKRHEAYIKGELCFLKHVKENCNKASNDYFSKNYKTFADTVAIKPSEPNCKDPHSQVNMLRCKAIAEEFFLKSRDIVKPETLTNKTQMNSIIKVCRDTQSCMADSCLSTDSSFAKVEDGCNKVEMMGNRAVPCLLKIKEENKNLSKYTCLGNMDFYDMSETNSCEKFGPKRECVKTILKDTCGKESVEEFDFLAKSLVKMFKCK